MNLSSPQIAWSDGIHDARIGLNQYGINVNMDKYRIYKTPKLTDHHNIDTWSKIEAYMHGKGSATFDDLVQVCASHTHSKGGKGFVRYCIKNDWIVKI